MAQQDRTTLKGYFDTGDVPTAQQFRDLIDSFATTAEASAGGATWGAITGTLSSQSDLQAALDAKADVASFPDVSAFVTSDTTEAGGGTAVGNIVEITQAAYDALATPDADTLYIING